MIKPKTYEATEYLVPCRSITWEVVKSAYEPQLRPELTIPRPTMSSGNVNKVLTVLRDITTAEGSVFDLRKPPESRQLSSIHALLREIVLIAREDTLHLIANKRLASRDIIAEGVAEFVVRSGNHINLVVITAKRGDIYQAHPEILLLMDVAIAINEENQEPSDGILGVVTDYDRWIYSKRSLGRIDFVRDAIDPRRHDTDVERVAERLHAMLEV
ncbi:hypothetical protein JG688_00008286 [Phytophthora aleatoria]|uniref:Uncharacterized protein n=1 Tax=Phytophthora aleatoria TaxID=2496075 RepID=A0A8J5IRA5_9STRA|nr:hypothetical protein JG688_00008286 [Phytophthora aleatoria]